MKKIVLLITIQILCMHSFVVNAQRIFSTSYTMDDGLAANRVYSILQDSCGFMWFGTDDGLSRFDGIAFKNYYLSEYINATTSNSVKKIFIEQGQNVDRIGYRNCHLRLENRHFPTFPCQN